MDKVTIKEVAKKANVSIATVSRVLNNNYPVSEDVRLKVLEAISELNYQPNGVARSLKSKRTHMIGIVVADITNPYFMQIAKGVESVVSSKGYNLIFCSTNENPTKELKLLRLLNEKRVDAIVLATCDKDGSYIKQLIEHGTPVIMVDRKIHGLNADTIVEDNFNAAYNITNYLINKGHKKISVVNGLLSISTGKERFEGFKKALEDNGILLIEKYVLKGNFNREDAYNAVKNMIKEQREDLPTAIFAANNLMAEGAMIAIYEQGLRIPEDISIVSFGDLSVPQLIKPKLTLISQNAYVIGQKAGEIALEKINGEKDNYREYVMVPDLRVGESVKQV
ncbi:MAG: LacI family DNA-binding transcriptional regulator [Thermoanaerobacteraceae bacterium]|nr:LacI family DNA-binding transcriptional regulator [Thermoanaerobacteraceae bacterium]